MNSLGYQEIERKGAAKILDFLIGYSTIIEATEGVK